MSTSLTITNFPVSSSGFSIAIIRIVRGDVILRLHEALRDDTEGQVLVWLHDGAEGGAGGPGDLQTSPTGLRVVQGQQQWSPSLRCSLRRILQSSRWVPVPVCSSHLTPLQRERQRRPTPSSPAGTLTLSRLPCHTAQSTPRYTAPGPGRPGCHRQHQQHYC